MWILGAIIGALFIGALASNATVKITSSPIPSDAPSISPPSPGTANAEVAAVGAHVRDGKFEFSVESVKGGMTLIGDNPFLQKKAQGQFVVVAVMVTNIGDAPQSFSPSAQKMIDTRGREFGADTAAQSALDGSDVPLWDNINPGNTADVKLVYDMPDDAVPAIVELHHSGFSGGAKVKIAP